MCHKYASYRHILNYYFSGLIIVGLSSPLAAAANNNAIYMPPGQSSQGVAPPLGDGLSPAMVTPGDTQRQDVPSGQPTSSPEGGTNLPHASEERRARINLLLNEQGGTRVALTFQPDQLTSEQASIVSGIIPGAMNSTEPYQNISVSEQQLEDMQEALAPYPNTQQGTPGKNGIPRKLIAEDAPANGYPKYESNGVYVMQKRIQEFCRYLVILGVVCGCIFMAFAAMGVIFGRRNAGSQVIGAAGGIILLLMAYSIWKVVRFNAKEARGPMVIDLENFSSTPLTSRSYDGDTNNKKDEGNSVPPGEANLPVIPGVGGSVNRSGLPLQPLGSAH